MSTHAAGARKHIDRVQGSCCRGNAGQLPARHSLGAAAVLQAQVSCRGQAAGAWSRPLGRFGLETGHGCTLQQGSAMHAAASRRAHAAVHAPLAEGLPRALLLLDVALHLLPGPVARLDLCARCPRQPLLQPQALDRRAHRRTALAAPGSMAWSAAVGCHPQWGACASPAKLCVPCWAGAGCSATG